MGRIQVKDIMSVPAASCDLNADVSRVRIMMDEFGYGAMPVVEEIKGIKHIRGIVTVKNLSGVYANIGVKQVMTEKVVVVLPEASAQSAAKLMVKKKIHHLVVMEEGTIIGMLSSADFVRLVANHHLE